MLPTTYQTLFAKLDSLGCVRKEVSFGCEVKYVNQDDYTTYVDTISSEGQALDYFCINLEEQEIIGHPPILSDCMKALYKRLEQFDRYEQTQNCDRLLESFPYDWNYELPYLKDQSEELGQKLISLL